MLLSDLFECFIVLNTFAALLSCNFFVCLNCLKSWQRALGNPFSSIVVIQAFEGFSVLTSEKWDGPAGGGVNIILCALVILHLVFF